MTDDQRPRDILAELEIWHSRPFTPTRRLALGNVMLPIDPAPGLGGILLGGIVAAHIAEVDEDLVPDVTRLIHQVERGERVVQPRLRNRFQVDRHGLARSVHRLTGDGESLSFEFPEGATALQQVLGAIYVLERLETQVRSRLAGVLTKAMTWRGPLEQSFVAYLAGTAASSISQVADPRAWALEILGFPAGTIKPSKKEIQAKFREGLRTAHPDHGGNERDASRRIEDLGEARRVLLGA
jgi:hypothetical protein